MAGFVPGFVPAIHVLRAEAQKRVMDARDKSGDGHDVGEVICSHQDALGLTRN